MTITVFRGPLHSVGSTVELVPKFIVIVPIIISKSILTKRINDDRMRIFHKYLYINFPVLLNNLSSIISI